MRNIGSEAGQGRAGLHNNIPTQWQSGSSVRANSYQSGRQPRNHEQSHPQSHVWRLNTGGRNDEIIEKPLLLLFVFLPGAG